MTYTIRDIQGRVAALGHSPGPIDGMMGPKTRAALAAALEACQGRKADDLFDRGVRGIVWHWTAGANGLIELERDAYNFLGDNDGNSYDGNSTIAEQVMYDWRKGIGASHTFRMNTGWIGGSLDAMAGARQTNPITWGKNPITWEGIDAILERTAWICGEYRVPVFKTTTLSHAEVQPTLGIRQRDKWDYMVLPGDTKSRDPVEVGDILRERMVERFM